MMSRLDRLKAVFAKHHVLGADEQDFVKKFSPFIHSGNVERFIDELNKAYYHMERNANVKILFMDLAFKFNELLNIPKGNEVKIN